MEELKPIQKTAEALSQSIRAKETLIDKIVEPDGAVDLETICERLTDKEQEAVEPIYYKALKHEPIDVIEDWGLGFLLGSALKYLSRAGKKADNPAIQDLMKARYYIDREIQRLKKL